MIEFLGAKIDTDILINICHNSLYNSGWYEVNKKFLTPEKELEYLRKSMADTLKSYGITHHGTVVEMTEVERKLKDAFTAREEEI